MKNVVITGISKGIGNALANKFLKEGWFVIGTSTTDKVDIQSSNFSFFVMDYFDQQSIKNTIDEIKKLNLKIDILINNAGALFDEDDTVVIVDKLRKTLEVNLIGTIDFTEGFLGLLNSNSHIINISSSAGSISDTGRSSHFEGYYPSYKISKAALNMYTKTLALRLNNKMIVSAVHPGWVKTDMGGKEADISATEAAENIYNFGVSEPETGQFWFNGKRLPW